MVLFFDFGGDTLTQLAFNRDGQVSNTIIGLLLFITLHLYNWACRIGFIIGNQVTLYFQSGCTHFNTLFDTREYEVKFTDGTTERYPANVIASNMYAQVDDKGNTFQLLSEIVDHKKDRTAIDVSDGM
jgi:hypothetical protein